MKNANEVPENPTNEQVIEALNNLNNAMSIMSAIWEKANDEQDNALANSHYPFVTDFDSFMHEVIDWAWEAKEILGGEK